MDGVITKFLGASGEFELASASARFSFSAHLEVGFGVGSDDFAEEFSELGGMFSFFESVTLIGFRDFRIAFAFSLTAHRKVHTNFGALSGKVFAKTFDDFSVFNFAVADRVNGGVTGRGGFGLFLEFGSRSSTLRTLSRSGVAFINVTTNFADELFLRRHVSGLSHKKERYRRPIITRRLPSPNAAFVSRIVSVCRNSSLQTLNVTIQIAPMMDLFSTIIPQIYF